MPSGLLNGNIKYQTDQFQRRQVHEREGGEPGREEDDREPTLVGWLIEIFVRTNLWLIVQKLCKPIQRKCQFRPHPMHCNGEKPIQTLPNGKRKGAKQLPALTSSAQAWLRWTRFMFHSTIEAGQFDQNHVTFGREKEWWDSQGKLRGKEWLLDGLDDCQDYKLRVGLRKVAFFRECLKQPAQLSEKATLSNSVFQFSSSIRLGTAGLKQFSNEIATSI